MTTTIIITDTKHVGAGC
ncbi:hypothetical protein NB519_14675 [Vibrio antiquarius]|nr:hypothetical protein [Vibrio antiquarius]MCR9618983.1 hypothetical protein [Vibrio antiquarius]